MRAYSFALLLAVSALASPAQNAAPVSASALGNALTGSWTGVLEYRDYAEPPTSTKRVQLPTWLSIAPAGGSLTLHYVYDDGPEKIIDETEQLSLDPTHGTYTTMEAGHAPEIYSVAGYEQLREGRGTLTLTGPGLDNNKPADMRVTLTVRRNLLCWLLESRPKDSTEAFTFRHRYTFTRAASPALTSKPPAPAVR